MRLSLTSLPLQTGLALVVLLGLSWLSLTTGVARMSLGDLLRGGESDTLILLVSRLPRTIAIVLTGISLAIAGLIFQMLTRNKFVEPSTAGTADSAGLGLLIAVAFFPAAPLILKMGIAAAFALAGTMLFLQILSRLPPHQPLLVPLVGLMLGGIIGAIATFAATQADLLQYLAIWTTGEFSGVIQGRYELLWLTAGFALLGYLFADRFSIIGLGDEISVSLGLNLRVMMMLGLVIVAVISSVVVVTVGNIPFLGLIVPNIVSRLVGDNLRLAVPWAASLGAGLLLLCDLAGRTLRAPYEIPVGTVFGVVGAAVFLLLILGGRRHASR